MLILFQDDLENAPDKVLHRALKFIGVEVDGFLPSDAYEAKNRFSATFIGVNVAFFLPKRLKDLWIKLDRFILAKTGLPKIKYPQLSEEDINWLKAFYEDDLIKLGGLVKIPAQWNEK